MVTAKVFWIGGSQAVRLPQEFRFDTAEVRIRRQGDAIFLEPVPENWDWLDDLVGKLDEDAAQAALGEPPQR